jgi:uncharacterized membrane protein YdbT with pleckstrin-like domain
MEENPVVHPGVPEEKYQKLGWRTLMIFVLQRIQAPLLLLVVSFVLFGIQGQSFLVTKQFGNLVPYVNLAAAVAFGLFIVFFILGFFIAWLIYINYKFCLGEDSLKIKRGILNKEEIAIPYRQIQDVDLVRDFSFLILGLSRIIILTAGHEDHHPDDEEDARSVGLLPALDKDLAEWLQAQLLKRTNVQKVTMQAPDAPASNGQ